MPNHKRAARILGFALTLGSDYGWTAYCAVIHARLNRQERMALAWYTLWALDEADAAALVEAMWEREA